MVLPYVNMTPLLVYTCSQSWTPLPPPSLYHRSGSSQCTSPKHPASCIEPRLAIHFLYDIIHVSMPFSQIIPPLPSPTESKRLFHTSVSLLLSHIQGYHYHLSKFHTYVLVSTGAGEPRGAIPRWKSGRAAMRRYLSSKKRSSTCALLEQPWRDTRRPS